MRNETIALLLTIAPLCAFAFAAALVEGVRLYKLNSRN